MNVRPITDEDEVRLVHGWLTDSANTKWLDFGQRAAPQLLTFRMMIQRRDDVYWVFTPDGSDTPIGLVVLNEVNLKCKTGKLWLVLGDRQYARKGYALRALDRLLDHAFFGLGLEALHAWIAEDNERSLRVASILGFRCMGRQRRCHWLDGRIVDRVLFDLVREEYTPLENAQALRESAS
jgi:RimJ/RimL family protein N-acetyltransferase